MFVPAFSVLLIIKFRLPGAGEYNEVIMDSPETRSQSSWLQRFSTVELAVLVFVFSVMGAVVWYKKFYEPRVAIVPSKSSASQKSSPSPESTPEPTPTPTPDAAAESNPFSNVYTNPFAQ